MSPDSAAAKILMGRHACVSFANPEQIELVAEICQSFILDNGAFSEWKLGKQVDFDGYHKWVMEWECHPGFDWALIPDVIDGSEKENDDFLKKWKLAGNKTGVPVWHIHESLARLSSLTEKYEKVAFGSSGQYSTIGTIRWWARMNEAMAVVTKNGRPFTKLHGLRMLDPEIFTKFPFASTDSTNVARSIGLDNRWNGSYQPPSKAVRGIVLAERIESQQSASVWVKSKRGRKGLF